MISTVVEFHPDRLILSMPEDAQGSCLLQKGDIVDLLPRVQQSRNDLPRVSFSVKTLKFCLSWWKTVPGWMRYP